MHLTKWIAHKCLLVNKSCKKLKLDTTIVNMENKIERIYFIVNSIWRYFNLKVFVNTVVFRKAYYSWKILYTIVRCIQSSWFICVTKGSRQKCVEALMLVTNIA